MNTHQFSVEIFRLFGVGDFLAHELTQQYDPVRIVGDTLHVAIDVFVNAAEDPTHLEAMNVASLLSAQNMAVQLNFLDGSSISFGVTHLQSMVLGDFINQRL